MRSTRASAAARRRRALGAVLLVGASVCACATPPPAPLTRDAQTLPDAELDRRVDFITQRLEASRTPARIWHWSWLAINGGAGAALNTGLAIADDNKVARSSAIVQAVYGAVGVATQFVDPMNAQDGAEPLKALPDATRAEKVQKLERAEAILQQNAARNAQRTSWTLHLGNAAASAAAGLIVYAFGGKTDAAITGGSIFAGGELFLWTMPPGPVRDLEDYQALIQGHGPGAGAPTSSRAAFSGPRGLFSVRF